jgi:hypothetical protein
MDLSRRVIVERMVWSLVIIEHQIAREARPRFPRTGVVVRMDLLILRRAPQPLDEDVVVSARPLTSMLIRTSAASGKSRRHALVKRPPWSLFQITCSGPRYLGLAQFRRRSVGFQRRL